MAKKLKKLTTKKATPVNMKVGSSSARADLTGLPLSYLFEQPRYRIAMEEGKGTQ